MRLFFLLVFLFGKPVAAATASGMEVMRKHFEWAEYDSLTTKIPQWENSADLSDSERARLANYQGVARFMRGDSLGAKDSYETALRLADTVSVDPIFVNEETYAYYNRVRAGFQAREIAAPPPVTLQHSSGPGASGWMAGLCFAASAGLGYFSYAAFDRAEGHMTEWRETEDPERWEELRDIIEKEDVRTLTYGGASLVAAGIGTYFLIRKVMRPQPEAQGQAPENVSFAMGVLPSSGASRTAGAVVRMRYRF